MHGGLLAARRSLEIRIYWSELWMSRLAIRAVVGLAGSEAAGQRTPDPGGFVRRIGIHHVVVADVIRQDEDRTGTSQLGNGAGCVCRAHYCRIRNDTLIFLRRY